MFNRSQMYPEMAREIVGLRNMVKQNAENPSIQTILQNNTTPNTITIPKEDIPDTSFPVPNGKTGYIASFNNTNSLDKMLYSAASNELAENMMHLSRTNEFMQNSIYNLNNQINKNGYKILNNVDNNAINNYFHLDKDLLIPNNNWRGIVFSSSSKLYKAIINSKDFQIFLRDNDEKIKDQDFDHLSFPFTSENNKDLFGSIHNITVLQPKINQNGDFSAVLYDKYDFDWRYYGFPLQWLAINDIACLLQQMGEIKNYYILIPIELNKSQLDQILNNKIILF